MTVYEVPSALHPHNDFTECIGDSSFERPGRIFSIDYCREGRMPEYAGGQRDAFSYGGR